MEIGNHGDGTRKDMKTRQEAMVTRHDFKGKHPAFPILPIKVDLKSCTSYFLQPL